MRLAPFAVALVFVLAIVLYGAWLRRNREAQVDLPLVGEGVTLNRLAADAVPSGPAVQAQEGDWLLETAGLRVTVGADAEGFDRNLRHGTILDLARLDMSDDALMGLMPALDIQGAPVALAARRVAPALQNRRPVLVLTHEAKDPRVTLETTLSVKPGSSALTLVTRVKNESKQVLRAVAVGDVVSWPGATSFAPRLGYVEATTHARVPWLARRGNSASLALAYPSGADVDFRFSRIGPTEQRAMTRAADLAPGAYHEVKRTLHVAAGGLGPVARAAWNATGRSTRTIAGKLVPAPAWATIEARHPDGRVVLAVSAERDGGFALPVPPGEYELVLRAPGGEDSTRVDVVDGTTPLGVKLIAPDPGQLRFSVVDENQRPLAARWSVSGIAPTKTPFFGPTERAEGAGHGGYTLTGDGRVQLPKGKYQVTFSQGPERALWESLVEIGPDKGATVRAELPRRVETPGWIACDFHLHAAPSHDSSVSLEDRVVSLVASGIELAVPTDHNHVTDYGPALSTLGASQRMFTVPGVELTTQAFGHFNAYPYPPTQALPKLSVLDPNGIFSALRSVAPEAVIQVNHPRMPGIGYFGAGKLDPELARFASDIFSFDFDVLEVINGFELGQPDVMEQNFLEWMALLVAGRRYTAVGNSDSHWLSREFVGYPRTYLHVSEDQPDRLDAAQLVSALKSGRAFVTNGPFVDAKAAGAGPGELATTEDGSLTVEVAVRAPAWVDVSRAEVWVNGVRSAVTQAPANGTAEPRLAWQTSLQLERDSWIVVVVHGERNLDAVLPGVGAKPFAFTNPIWVDVDGDGAYDAGGLDGGDATTPDATPSDAAAVLDGGATTNPSPDASLDR